MATIAKRTVKYWGLSLMDGIGRQKRSEHDFRPYDVWQVKVCSFTFSFIAMEQLDACLDYYSKKIHPSSRIYGAQFGGADYWEVQRWFERLPMYLLEEPKRLKVIRALTIAKKKWQNETQRNGEVS
jgi:hypothetical protein